MKNEINVTPLIDVMLVLLILFMIVTPVSQKGLDVRLPETAGPNDRGPSPVELVLEVDRDGELIARSLRCAGSCGGSTPPPLETRIGCEFE